jgi:hypothetical protein
VQSVSLGSTPHHQGQENTKQGVWLAARSRYRAGGKQNEFRLKANNTVSSFHGHRHRNIAISELHTHTASPRNYTLASHQIALRVTSGGTPIGSTIDVGTNVTTTIIAANTSAVVSICATSDTSSCVGSALRT